MVGREVSKSKYGQGSLAANQKIKMIIDGEKVDPKTLDKFDPNFTL
ncbi:hypothetical protein [Bacillus thuringiensis]|nr:hypothetical protein [Bacillus thuringiensis]MED2915284.1 hypothetical protein [Bacillus thuringiensis]MED2922753.1 hypothetical protein [Bacillus thuringiensis]MED3050921.1 hypothetical protein [Bacillus thuringiensis]MED3057125.1 hypothetical protein [Bacillus thuringiensis]